MLDFDSRVCFKDAENLRFWIGLGRKCELISGFGLRGKTHSLHILWIGMILNMDKSIKKITKG